MVGENTDSSLVLEVRKGNYKPKIVLNGCSTYDKKTRTLVYTLRTPLEPSEMYTVVIDKERDMDAMRYESWPSNAAYSMTFMTSLKSARLLVKGVNIPPFVLTFAVPASNRLSTLRSRVASGIRPMEDGIRPVVRVDEVEGVSLMLGGEAVELKEESDVCALKDDDVLVVRLKGGV